MEFEILPAEAADECSVEWSRLSTVADEYGTIDPIYLLATIGERWKFGSFAVAKKFADEYQSLGWVSSASNPANGIRDFGWTQTFAAVGWYYPSASHPELTAFEPVKIVLNVSRRQEGTHTQMPVYDNAGKIVCAVSGSVVYDD